ncbi:AIPR family protein [Actinomadura violacea]|uniref:AIPR family protein n=1 Tax=Actinomadura violacea TaxID=2819934 RepID=A0ABS3RP73_9ACTN|nr:AIPR family protein [Actinomadura violacea]MBO2458557.1 AIPR family protein [Actinomadura violacea]
MSSAQRSGGIPTQVQHVRQALLRDYDGLIYSDDLKGYQESAKEQRFLSRALTASAVRLVTGCGHEEAGRAVIDGEDDQGIDGVAVDESSRDVWLFQAKWSDAGTGKLDQGAALKLIEGLRLIERREIEGNFNYRIDQFKGQLDVAMGDARLRITLVIALMGPAKLSDAVTRVLDRACRDFNSQGPMLTYRVIGGVEFHQQLRQDLAPAPIDVEATMSGWFKKETPFRAWQGMVAVRDVAQWYADHGDGLYEQNVRNSLGLTPTNSGIEETLLNEPENFCYFNNGITVLCDSIEPQWPRGRQAGEPVRLRLNGVSVANGIQTISAIHNVMKKDANAAGKALVTVRALSLGKDRSTFAKRITETINTHNDVSQREFVALDTAQAEIREDFLLSLWKTYVYKKGEPDPSPDAGCSVEHAALALACAHQSPELVVRARQRTDSLWERGTTGSYPRLFGEVPSAYRIWRLVLAWRSVGTVLEQRRNELQGRAASMARWGDLFIAHLVFQLLDLEGIDKHGFDEESLLSSIPDAVDEVLSRLIHYVDSEYGPNSFLLAIFTDEVKCRNIANLVVRDARCGEPAPGLADKYRPKRKALAQWRSNKVLTPVAVDAIADSLKYFIRMVIIAELVRGK